MSNIIISYHRNYFVLFNLYSLISYYHVLYNINILDIVVLIILADWLAITMPGYDLNIVRNFSLEVFPKPTDNPKHKVIPVIFPLYNHVFYSGITYNICNNNFYSNVSVVTQPLQNPRTLVSTTNVSRSAKYVHKINTLITIRSA